MQFIEDNMKNNIDKCLAVPAHASLLWTSARWTFRICISFPFAADSDNTWKIAHVPLEVDAKFRYAFQAVRGDPTTSTGGIYIDDISLTETRCPNAVWRIQNFSKIMETANTTTVIDSPRFYSPEGYAYGVRIMPLSAYTDFTGNYAGLYFQLYSGENDAVMQWPVVNRQATIVVMDQDPDITHRMSTARSLTTDLRTGKCTFKHFYPMNIIFCLIWHNWTVCLSPDSGNLIWDNPSKVGTYDSSCECYRGSSWGWRNFVKHFDLRRRNYLKNDDLIIFVDFEGKCCVFESDPLWGLIKNRWMFSCVGRSNTIDKHRSSHSTKKLMADFQVMVFWR